MGTARGLPGRAVGPTGGGLQPAAQGPTSPVEVDLDGGGGAPEPLGHVDHRQVVQVVEHHRAALALGQLGQGPGQVDPLGDQRVDRWPGSGPVGRRSGEGVVGPAEHGGAQTASLLEGEVDGDAPHPGTRTVELAHPAPVGIGHREGVVGQLVGPAVVAHHRPGGGHHRLALTGVEAGERGIAMADLADPVGPALPRGPRRRDGRDAAAPARPLAPPHTPTGGRDPRERSRGAPPDRRSFTPMRADVGAAATPRWFTARMFKVIVVGVTEADTARLAAEQAVELARDHGAELHLVAAVADEAALVEAAESAEADRAREIMEGVVSALADRERIQLHALPGAPAKAIVQVADERNADLIVVGSKGAGRRLLSSVPHDVVAAAPCSVLVVKTT